MRNAKSIPEIYKLLSENLLHNLRLAKTDEERRQFITATLTAFGQKVIPPLNQLKEIHSDGNPELDSARLAALELASVICGGLVRSAADYRTAINSLDALTDICREPQLKVKLVFYTNQLKKRWLIIEPGGLAHNPRAKRMTTERTGKSQMTNILVSLVFLGALFFVLLGLDLTKLIFPVQNSSQPAQQLPHNSEVRQVAPPLSPLQQIQPASSTRNESTLYTFTDKQGVVHMVDMLEKVPQAYRRNMKVDTSGPSVAASTTVFINGNQVIVPVTINYRGRSVTARLLLDTGATVTTISEALAGGLGVSGGDVQPGKSTVADGRSVGSYTFKVDTLSVGDHHLPNADISILLGSGGRGYDGLLGMNYLKNFRYHVNFDRSVIEWGG